MKKVTWNSLAVILTLAFLLVAASPASAAGYVVNAAQLNANNQVVVYIEVGSSPYLANTVTVSGFSVYPTTCVSNGNNVLACYIHGQIAQQHPGQTAYIVMTSADDKAWFTVPEAQPHNHCIPKGPSAKARCCNFNAPCGG